MANASMPGVGYVSAALASYSWPARGLCGTAVCTAISSNGRLLWNLELGIKNASHRNKKQVAKNQLPPQRWRDAHTFIGKIDAKTMDEVALLRIDDSLLLIYFTLYGTG